MRQNKEKNFCEPIDQLSLYGYDDYFTSFKNLYEKNKLPNTILLTGQKGIGKSTFAYHFINYLLSQEENDKYILENFTINENNPSFKLIHNQVHPNFFLLKNSLSEENIKIDQARSLIKFLNKSTYSLETKIVLIDNTELLNINSSNALLKTLEEPNKNTFFFIINNSASKVPETIRSRCVEYRFRFNTLKKKDIFNKITQDYHFIIEDHDVEKFLYFDTPGNLLKYLLLLKDSNLDIYKDLLSCILYLFDIYKSKKNFEMLNFISIFIENFYREISLRDSSNLNTHFVNKYKILHMINDMRKFNLDKKNFPLLITTILKNETQ